MAVQAAVDAAAASPNGGGTIFWPAGCLTNITTCINLPQVGNYEFAGAGSPSGLWTVNANSGPTNGILIRGDDIAGQPATIGKSNLCKYIFNCSGAAPGQLTVAWRNLLVYNFAALPGATLALLTGSAYQVDFDTLLTVNLGMFYYHGGNFQTWRFTIRGCTGGPSFLGWCDDGAPFMGDISGNVWALPGDSIGNPLPNAEWLETNTFWTWNIHHNTLYCAGSGTHNRGVIAYTNIEQTTLGSIDHNQFYGSSGACIYIQDLNSSGILSYTGGLVIDSNEFSDWNHDNIGGGYAAAIYIDTAPVPPPQRPDQIITIGKNIFVGGLHSAYGIVIVDNPDIASVVFDREQNMRFIQTAPYRIGGVNYGAAGTSHRFQANLTAPAIPPSNSALTNPFGFDATVYLTGNASAVAVNGITTGLTSGMFRVPRDATIKLTYKARPSWKWFAD